MVLGTCRGAIPSVPAPQVPAQNGFHCASLRHGSPVAHPYGECGLILTLCLREMEFRADGGKYRVPVLIMPLWRNGSC